MSNSDPSQSDCDSSDDELKLAMMAAFGDDAMSLLDEDDEFDADVEEPVVDIAENNTSPAFKKMVVEESDSKRVRWIKELSNAIYADRLQPTKNGRSDSGSQSATSRFVVFAVAEQLFGLPMSEVHEIAHYPCVTELPRTPAWIRGVANFHGQILSVTDLRSVFQLDGEPPVKGEKVVVVHNSRRSETTAIVVDQVVGIRTITDFDNDKSGLSNTLQNVCSRLGQSDQLATVLIDSDRLFDLASLIPHAACPATS